MRFLSEELFTDVTEGEKFRLDLVVETKLKGEPGLIIVHVEPQSYHQDSFNERMFIYFSRLHQKYRRKILPITIFSYDYLRDEPTSFKINFPFAKILDFRYLTIVLKKENWRNYLRSNNPVAAALLCKMGYTNEEKIEVKKEFFRMLIRLELDKARESLIAGFFDMYLKLNEEEERQFQNEVKAMNPKEGEKIMEIMTSYERKGREEEKVSVAKKLLLRKTTLEEIVDITGLSKEVVEKIRKEF